MILDDYTFIVCSLHACKILKVKITCNFSEDKVNLFSKYCNEEK